MDEPAAAPRKVEFERKELKEESKKEEKPVEKTVKEEEKTGMDALAEELDDGTDEEEITELESDLDLEEDKEAAIKKKRQEEDEKILAEFKKDLSAKLIKPKKNIDFLGLRLLSIIQHSIKY